MIGTMSRTRMNRHGLSYSGPSLSSGGRISMDTVNIPSPLFFTGLGFILGGIFWPALMAGTARLSDITVGRIVR